MTIPPRFGAAAVAGALTLMAAAPAAAQDAPASPRWEAWAGCWQPVVRPAAVEEDAAAPVTCVIPAGADGVEIVAIADDEVVHREVIRDHRRRQVEREGCSGWESAEASADGRRVFRRSELACTGGLVRRSTGVMAMDADEWLDVTGVSVDGSTAVQVVRYQPVEAPEALDAGARAALQGSRLALESARVAAAAPIDVEDVIEATRRVDTEVVEAWLVERRQGFAVDAARLVALEEAGVPASVIDLMVALSYPGVFAIDYNDREAERRPEAAPGRTPRARPMYGWAYPGYGRYPGYGYGGYWGRPVVIVQRPSGSGGKAVKGKGYTRGNSGGTGTTASSPRPSGSKGSAGGSAPAPRRTAKPRSGG